MTTTRMATSDRGTVGTRRARAGGWEGVLRQGGAVVAYCGHSHVNRNMSGRTRSAFDCMIDVVRAADNEAVAESIAAGFRVRRIVATGRIGVDRARAANEAEAVAFEVAVASVRAVR